MRGCLVFIGVAGSLAAIIVFLVYDAGGFNDSSDPSEQEAVGAWLGALFFIALVALLVWIFTKLR